jgi:hypothetical protein
VPSQTALDYAEPGQRALLVEGIRPVLPLIRNTPYGKRIQNKLQREQMDHYGGGVGAGAGGYGQHMALNTQALGMGPGGARHVSPQALHPAASLADVYGAQNGLYGLQGAGLQGHAVDAYVLQGAAAHGHGHGQGLQSGFSTVSPFQGAGPFAGAGLAGALNVPYQRSTSFGYGM